MELDMTLGGIISVCTIFLFLASTTVFLRLFARYRQKTGFMLDDYIVAGAWVCFIGLNALVFYGISHKFIGHNMPKDTATLDAQHRTLERVFLSLDGLCIMALGLAKLSALFFFRRIFCSTGARDAFNIVSGIYIGIVSIWIVVFFVMTWNLCGHHSISWDVQVGHSALCKLDYPYFKAVTISDFIIELFVIILPLPKVWSLNMVTSRKFAVTGVFLLALVGVAASLARMVITLRDVNHGVHVIVDGKVVNKSKDVYRTETSLAYCIILEAGSTIVAVNLPSLWYYTAGLSLESVVRSVRSLVSLGSGHGSQSNSIRTGKSLPHRQSLDTTSASSLKLGPGPTVETFAMTDLDKKILEEHREGIHVDHEFHRVEAEV